MNKFIWKRIEILTFVVLAFILGCTITLGLMPIDKNCKIDDSDREFNIMKNSKFKNPELIILILSAPSNYEKRTLVRKTWLQLKPNEEKKIKIKHYFVIGVASLPLNTNNRVSVEQVQFGDVLMLPIVDSYNNLTEKIKLSFQWLDTQYDYGLGFKYVLKCDDDSFVNLVELAKELMYIEGVFNSSNPFQKLKNDRKNFISTNYHSGNSHDFLNIYWGYFSGNAKIKTKGKWKETDWIASDRYVPYALGGGYLLSKGLISYIARNAEMLRSFNSEDISVGLWLISVNNVVRIHDIRFDTEWISRGCKNTHLVKHNILPVEMKQLYNNLVQLNIMCSPETTKRNYYLYDWSVPPSQCCKTNDERVIKLSKG